jgi:hypothetical protein
MFAMLPDKLASFTGLLTMLFDTYGGELQPYRMNSWTQAILQGSATCASHAP